MSKLPNKSGPVRIKVSKYIDEIFEIDQIASRATPNILPLESKEKFLDFFEIKNKTNTFIWNNKNGATTGFLSYIEGKDGRQIPELFSLIVLPKYWRKGFGSKMVAYYHDLMRKKGFKKSRLVTSPLNEKAIKFYEKLGYTRQKIIKDYFGPGEDRILMTFDL